MQFHDRDSSSYLHPILPNITFSDSDPIYKPFAFITHLLSRQSEFHQISQTIKNIGKSVSDLRRLSTEDWTSIALPLMLKHYVRLIIHPGLSSLSIEEEASKSSITSSEELSDQQEFPSDLANKISNIFSQTKYFDYPTDTLKLSLFSKFTANAPKISKKDSYLQEFDFSIFEENTNDNLAKETHTMKDYKIMYEELKKENENLEKDFNDLLFLSVFEIAANFFKGFARRMPGKSREELQTALNDFSEEYGITNEVMEIILENEGITENELLETAEKKGEDSEKMCVVCLTEEAVMVIMECMHLCLCANCAEFTNKSKKTSKKKECPICKQKISKIRKIYK